ncbi:MAG: PhzF family phenazine biosynthesis protein [Spirochaetes bacterium]|nr:PhzF family phenazine biosynthesis protein [Spirochaetota bacterium]
MTIPLHVVDAFTSKTFKGNPAGVCLLEKELSSELCQKIAAEMRHSETAFLLKKEDNHYHLKWFTPKAEVKLCGHATLASAHILAELKLINKNQKINFSTLSGILTAEFDDSYIHLDFPQQQITQVHDPEKIDFIEQLFQIKTTFVGSDPSRYLIELKNEQTVLSVNPDFSQLQEEQLDNYIITAKADDPKYDFISRYFAPKHGVYEDPVTGSAHCFLAPYWSKKIHKSQLTGFQASTRTGIIKCNLINDQRIILSGQAITFLSGEISIS